MDLNCINVNQWDVITNPCHNFNGGLTKPPLKIGHGLHPILSFDVITNPRSKYS